MLHLYEEVEIWQGDLGALLPQNLAPSFSLYAQCPPQGHAPSPTKQWGNFGIWELKAPVRKENARKWLEQLRLVLGSSGLSQEGTCPTAQEGR